VECLRLLAPQCMRQLDFTMSGGKIALVQRPRARELLA
jgi:hypothetical protein